MAKIDNPREVPAEGYPVTIKLDGKPDGRLTLTWADGTREHYDVSGGTTEASTAERAAHLLSIGGVVVSLSSPPAGSGTSRQGNGGDQG